MFQKLKFENKGFTMAEVVIAALIFAMAAAGMFATISALRQPAEESREEISAAYIGKEILEHLRKEIDATDWDTGAFNAGGTCPGAPGTAGRALSNIPGYTADTITVDGIVYTPTYDVTCDPEGTAGKKITLNIAW